jgi:hypothetical protein
MGILGILAAVALLIGGAGTTAVLVKGDRLATEDSKTPVVEVQIVKTDEAKPKPFEY